MKRFLPVLLPLMSLMSCTGQEKTQPTLKSVLGDDFLIGAAIPTSQIHGFDAPGDSLTRLHFNQIVPENCMKSEKINPAEGVYNWTDADAFVDYGNRNNLAVIGHVLVWHSQLAPWFAVDKDGNPVSAEVLKERMRNHIHTVVGRYKGRIKGWDVVNEAILDDGSYRHSPFYDILGEEFIPLAFEYAHEADPDCELYINDFSMAMPGKREAYVRIANDLKKRGLRIDGIGMQGHMGIDYPDLKEFEKSMVAYGSTGCKVMITEWDMSAIPTVKMGANVGDREAFRKSMNPYPDGLPAEVDKEWNDRMAECLDLFRKHKDIVSRVTLWGTHDGMTWRNDWPMRGRTDYPLAFDREYKLKPAFSRLLNTES